MSARLGPGAGAGSAPVPAGTGRSLTDTAAVALALAAAAGALAAVDPIPAWVAGALVAVSLLGRRPRLLILATGLLTSSLAAAGWEGLEPRPARSFSGEVALVSDPAPVAGAVRVEVATDGRRVEAWARGPAASALGPRLAGDRVTIEGRLRPVPADARRRLAARHIGARMTVHEVSGWRPGPPAARVANAVRQTLLRGAEPMGDEGRALLAGFVLGDTRAHPAELVADFRGSGLTHLLAVSGQNVGIVLILAAPALCLFGLRARWVAAVAVIALFALVTRFEPSVMRASAMAVLAVTSHSVGRPASRSRILALAVAALLVIDPLLVHSVGFRLSVAATAGIILGAGPLADRIPGPRALAQLVAVTLSAQAAVAPVLVATFGSILVSALPANLLAVPASGVLVAWGLGAGLVAGLVGGETAALLHLPTGALVAWVAGVARWGAQLPAGAVEAEHLAAAFVAGAGLLVHRRWVRAVAAVGLSGALLVLPALAARSPLEGVEVIPGMNVWRSGGAVVAVAAGDADAAVALGALRAHGVGHIDVLVLQRGGRREGALVAVLRQRLRIGAVLAPEGHDVRGAITPSAGTAAVGHLEVELGLDDGRLTASVNSSGR